jgi:AMP phosphorylase
MKLKVRGLKLNAGKPIAFLHERDATMLGVRAGDHVEISSNSHKVSCVVDIASGLFKKGELALSQECLVQLDAKKGSVVSLRYAGTPQAAKILQQRLKCKLYTKGELRSIIQDIVNGELSEAEIAYFVSGVHHCGLTLEETTSLTRAMVDTGEHLTWGSKKIADKHSIGGIPGNRTTPIVVSICSAAGMIMPKTSSRAITSAAGTADVIETLAPVDFSAKKLQTIVKKVGACLAWGGALGLAPADDKLIQIEKKLNVDPEPQLLASILSKKLAVGSTHVLIDIPYGSGAKVSLEEGKRLRERFSQMAKQLGLKVKVMLTEGSQPIGNGVGPVLEMHDILRVLRRDNPPRDLEAKSLKIAGALMEMIGKAPKGQGISKAQKILDSGAALKQFTRIIEAQGGSVRDLKVGKYKHVITASHRGKVTEVHNRQVNIMARIAGSPQDKAAGLYLHAHLGDRVEKGDPIITCYAESRVRLKDAIDFAHTNSIIEIE